MASEPYWLRNKSLEEESLPPFLSAAKDSNDQVHPSGRVIHKGVNPDIDSYSAFFDNAKLGKTNLEELIRKEVCRKVGIFFFST